nr:hypothetical protein BaRGS_027483 [Batillaria attramentaria]
MASVKAWPQEFWTDWDATVPVADCKKKEFSAHVKQEMKMWEFLTYWKQLQDAGENGDVHSDSLYLKDWHFTRAFPDYEAYSTVGFFRSDWMNEFWDVREDIDDDYRFVYMGPKGTWTPFHADVFRSFSWSANICGREEEFLKNKHGSLVYDVTSDELRDPRKFPNAHKAKHRIELVQNPGETIFVPSGWHHQVHNLDDTISINHNWLNGCNVRLCWAHLKDALKAVEKEISDCRDMDGWEQQCQLILKADTGLDFIEFFRFMETVAERRQLALNQWKQSSSDSQRYTANVGVMSSGGQHGVLFV